MKLQRSAAFVAFFLSGASSLVFQTLWSRVLSHVFGSSSIAISSVVSVFMAGLGLGAYFFGRRADRLRDPLLIYAIAETLVGAFALIIPTLVASDGFLARVNALLRHELGADSWGFMLARFACIAPILLVPTILMGSTLPLLARHFVTHSSSTEAASSTVGRLYAVNTFGAVAGVMASSFVLLPRFGVATANTVAACTNFALAALIFAMRSRPRQQPALASPEVPEGPSPTEPDAPSEQPLRVRRAAALAFAFSGFSSLLYEVVWSRALVNTIGGSLYSFALILTTFLIGIAGGSALAASQLRASAGARWAHTGFVLALTWVACGQLLLRHPWPWALAAAVLASALVVFLDVLGRSSATRAAALAEGVAVDVRTVLEQGQRRASLSLLGVPLVVAALVLAFAPDRIARVSFAVVSVGGLFAALVMTLRARPLFLLVSLQLFIACATLVSAFFADELSLTFATMVAPLYDALPDHVGTVQSLMFVTAALCILPSALGMGAVFPVTLRACATSGQGVGRSVGSIYAGNTVGSIVGAWLPGFVLMPTLGMQATLYVGMTVNVLMALMLVLAAGDAARDAVRADASTPHLPDMRRLQRTLAALALALPWVVAGLVFVAARPLPGLAWNISKMTLGAFRISLARDVLDEESWGEPDLVYYRDGLSTTVTVERWGRHYSLKNNGKVDASNGDDMPTQIMVAAMPLLLHPLGPEDLDVAIVGFGSGVTVGAALQFPVRSVEVVELEAATIEASRFFADVNHLDYVTQRFPYVRAERLQVHADDGRNFLAASRRQYDVIISEPSNPWLTGVSDLFTADHFAISKRKLAEGGVYCQWAQLYELSPANVKILYRTFAEHFRYVVVFSAEDLSSDTILVGSDSPLTFDLPRLRRAFATKHVAPELERAYIHSPFDVFARTLLADKREILRFTRGALINTDDNAHIELSAPRDLIGFERYKGYLETMYSVDWPYGAIGPLLRDFGEGSVGSENHAQLALSLLSHGRKREAVRMLDRARAHGESPALETARAINRALSRDASEPVFSGHPERVLAEISPSLRAKLAIVLDVVREARAASQPARALGALEALPASLRHDLGSEWDYLEAYLRYRSGDVDGAADMLETLLRREPSIAHAHPELHFYLARAHDALSRFDKAVRNMRAYVQGQGGHGAPAEPLPPPEGDPR